MKSSVCRLFIAVLLIVHTGLLQAQIYRWVDENGVVNYSDKPLKQNQRTKDGVEILEFTVSKKTPAPEADAKTADEKPAKQAARKELSELLSDSAIEQILQLTKEDNGFKADKCRALRRKLAALEEKDFATYRDEDGNYRVSWGDDGVYTGKREYLSRSEIHKETTAVKQQITKTCEPSDDAAAIQAEVRADWIRHEHCVLNKVILADLKQPDLRTTDTAIKAQEDTVQRYCAKLEQGQHRDDEDYYPTSFPVRETRR